jgi:hypothetical protein
VIEYGTTVFNEGSTAMELIAAIAIAGPLGYFIRPARRALVAYLAVWVTVFPIQTIVVFSTSGDGNDALYWVFNALILGLGLALNTAAARLRERRLRTSRG